MTRQITTAANNEATSVSVITCTLFRADFGSGVLLVNDSLQSIVWNAETYLGVGTLGQISTIEDNSDIKAAKVTATLSGVPLSLISIALNDEYQNKPASIWMAFFNKTTNVMIADPVLLFEGFIDTMTISLGETATVSITIENQLVQWQRSKVRRYTNAEQQSRFAGDDLFKYATQQDNRKLFWGRESK